MKKCLFWLIPLLFLSGCETTSEIETMPDSVVAVVEARPDQIVVAKNRASAIFARWRGEAKDKFVKQSSQILAVRTLSLTPDQAAAAEGRINGLPDSVVCVMLWDAKTGEVVGTDCFAVEVEPAGGKKARFRNQAVRYVGSM